jgi:hypothetical protein
VSKAELLQSFARSYRRTDIEILPTEASTSVDRTLGTANPSFNHELWQAAGYAHPPTVAQMVSELAEFDARFPEHKLARAGD